MVGTQLQEKHEEKHTRNLAKVGLTSRMDEDRGISGCGLQFRSPGTNEAGLTNCSPGRWIARASSIP